jgi:hypothetical protein
MSPLERAAKAAFEERERHVPAGGRIVWEHVSSTAREMAIAEMRAALKAIRLPELDMIRGAAKALDYKAADWADIWTAFVDEVLR